MRYFSMFSGIGGFELGIGNKAECIGYSEIDKYAIQIYEKHFKHKNYGDATKIVPRELPEFDLLVGGFPCQAFSIAGKRGGFNDTRGTLFFDIARIAKEKRPTNLLLENVKGLLSHNNGRTFKTIISTLNELGYDLQWQVLNSKNFGVPQNRERVFIVGHIRGEPRPQVFPFKENDKNNNEMGRHLSQRTKNRKRHIVNTDSEVSQNGENGHIHQINQPNHSNNRIYGKEGISPTLNTMQGGMRQPKIAIPVITPNRKEKRQNGRRFKNDGEPAFTLNTQDQHGVFDGLKIRRLTPTECERLQGFPDGWTKQGIWKNQITEISDTQRYKCLGNAVTVNVIEEIIKRMFEK